MNSFMEITEQYSHPATESAKYCVFSTTFIGTSFSAQQELLGRSRKGVKSILLCKNKNLLFKGNSIPSNYRRRIVLSNNKGFMTSNSFRILTQRRWSGGIRILRGNMSNDKSNNWVIRDRPAFPSVWWGGITSVLTPDVTSLVIGWFLPLGCTQENGKDTYLMSLDFDFTSSTKRAS